MDAGFAGKENRARNDQLEMDHVCAVDLGQVEPGRMEAGLLALEAEKTNAGLSEPQGAGRG
jgi:hypothetical protein